MSQFQENLWADQRADGRTDEKTDSRLNRQTLFYRTLPAKAGCSNITHCSTGWLLPMFRTRYFNLDRFSCSKMNDFQVIFSYILEKLVFVVFCESPQINFTWTCFLMNTFKTTNVRYNSINWQYLSVPNSHF